MGKIASDEVSEVTTYYHLVGDKVTYEINEWNEIYYTYSTYSSGGTLISMNLNGSDKQRTQIYDFQIWCESLSSTALL